MAHSEKIQLRIANLALHTGASVGELLQLAADAWDEALDEAEGCCMFISDAEEHRAGNPYR